MTDCRGPLWATLRTTLAFCSLLGTGTSIVKVDVRCYCNLPLCVATGYMCRSSAGVCISERGEGEAWRWRHSCLELLDPRQRAAPACEENVTRQCCTEDMCNYFGKAATSLSGQRRLNHSHVTGYLSNHDTSLLRGGGAADPRPWFGVTVVAVPVAGSLVLVVLVVMAIRMLRVERQRQTRLKPADTRVVFRTPKDPFLPKSLSCVLPGRSGTSGGHVVRSCASMGSIGPSGRLCRSGSLTLSLDSACTDSSREKYFVFDL